MAHENWRFRPWYRELKHWIAAGELGHLVLARMATFTSGLLPDATGLRPLLVREPYTQHEERLMIAEVLIHHLDVMRFLCGELRVVAARAARTVPDVVGETVAAIFLETASGAPVEVTGTMAAPGHPSRPPDRPGSHRQQGERHLRQLRAMPARAESTPPALRFRCRLSGELRRRHRPFRRLPRNRRPVRDRSRRQSGNAAPRRARVLGRKPAARSRQLLAELPMDTREESSRDLIGQSKLALDTPALLVDLDVMESEYRAHRRNLPRPRCRMAAPLEGAQDAGNRAVAARGRRHRSRRARNSARPR